MQTDTALKEYFIKCFSRDDVVADAHVALIIPNLEKKVAKRDKVVSKLEHAINVLTIKGVTPTHKTIMLETVESVPTYSKEIEDLNEEISRDIDRIEPMRNRNESGDGQDTLLEEDIEAAGDEEDRQLLAAETMSEVQSLPKEGERNDGLLKLDALRPAAVSNALLSSADAIKAMIVGEDGASRSAAFVSLSDLASVNLVRQAVHNAEPWFCVPAEPPMPDLVNWKNVGKSNESKQIGELIGLVLTTTLCIFWTIPVAFVTSFSNVESLTKVFPFLKAPVENYAWFSSFMALLAPLILVAFIALLPYIILAIIKFEGLIEIETMQHPSLYSKLAAFTIIQTFFISTVSGTLFTALQHILEDPKFLIRSVAKALPEQSAYFIQIIIVQNSLSLGIELLRISPIVQNILRKIALKYVGHNLTEKERNETFLGQRSLDDPLEYYFGRELGTKIVLLQMVLFVYGCMAPITCYFTLIVFGALAIGYRHQFLYVYPIANDSGGKLWMNFQRLSITCAILAEIILCAVLVLKSSYAAAVLMIPLIVATIIFDRYFKRRHYSITSFLPLGDCAAVDRNNMNEGMTNEWLKDAYLQPALKKRVVVPENFPEFVSTSRQRGQDQHPTTWDDEAALADDHKEKDNSYIDSKE